MGGGSGGWQSLPERRLGTTVLWLQGAQLSSIPPSSGWLPEHLVKLALKQKRASEKPVCRSRPCPSQGVQVPILSQTPASGRCWEGGGGGRREAVNKTNRTHSLGEFTVGEGRHSQDNQEGTIVVEIG